MKKARDKELAAPSTTKVKGLFFSGLILLIVIGVAAAVYFFVYPTVTNNTRKHRIDTIFSSLHLDSRYIVQREQLFGEKRPYESDKNRSQSSYKKYIRAADVKTTVTEVKRAIEDAGFTYFDEPYPGSLQVQYHFKSQKNEYIRMTVSSKPRDDAIQNKAMMGIPLTDADFALDGNAGPSNVIIKVNLDDNNE